MAFILYSCKENETGYNVKKIENNLFKRLWQEKLKILNLTLHKLSYLFYLLKDKITNQH